MTPSANPEESSREKMDRLENELTALAAELEVCKERIRNLTLAERPREGVIYAQELHEARQDKVRIETEMLMRRNRLRGLTPLQ